MRRWWRRKPELVGETVAVPLGRRSRYEEVERNIDQTILRISEALEPLGWTLEERGSAWAHWTPRYSDRPTLAGRAGTTADGETVALHFFRPEGQSEEWAVPDRIWRAFREAVEPDPRDLGWG
jgi:hypothetical protein